MQPVDGDENIEECLVLILEAAQQYNRKVEQIPPIFKVTKTLFHLKII